jgi:hypothetical protein
MPSRPHFNAKKGYDTMQHNEERHAFLVGAGIASLSAAVLLIRDGGFQGGTSTSSRSLRWRAERSMARATPSRALSRAAGGC